MSEKGSKENTRNNIGIFITGDVIGSVVGSKGKVRIDRLEVVKGDKITITYGDNTVTEIDVDNPFHKIYQQIASKPKGRKKLTHEIERIRQEVQKGDEIRTDFLQERLLNLARIAPDIFEVTVATLVNPALGFAVIVQKIATKACEDYVSGQGS